MYYPEELVEEVRASNDIVEVISQYIPLKKAGADYKGLCPFHGEKTPSFNVNPARQMYHCFGCGVSGNVYTFLMEYENLTFKEAVETLAERAGIKLPKMQYSKAQQAERDRKNTLLEINKAAALYFYRQLRNPDGEAGYRYLRDRKLTDETITHFGLGFSNKTSQDLYQHLKGLGYDDGILRDTGLITFKENAVFDKFWNRVMFPIMDVGNRVVGFGGRVMGEGEPKYLNSPETAVFDKSRTLYGLNFAKLARKDYLFLCEGYMDVIAMHQAGFTNAVASLGTALTENHAHILKRYTGKVVLTYDSDGAGVKAALRAIPMLRAAGISARVLNMRPYKDPDEFMKNLGREEFEKRVGEARNSFLYEIDRLKDSCDLSDPEQKTKFYEETAAKLAQFSEPLERQNYVEAVAREFYIPEKELLGLVNRMGLRLGTQPAAMRRGGASVGKAAGQTGGQADPSNEGPAGRTDTFFPSAAGGRQPGRKKKAETGLRQSEAALLTWLVDDPRLFDKISGLVGPEDFQEDLYRQVAGDVFAAHRASEDGAVNPAAILDRYMDDEENSRQVAALFHTTLTREEAESEKRKAFEETVKRIRQRSLERQIREASDIHVLQKLIREQAELSGLHINID